MCKVNLRSENEGRKQPKDVLGFGVYKVKIELTFLSYVFWKNREDVWVSVFETK